MSIVNSFLSKQNVNVHEEIELQINVVLAKKHHAYTHQFRVKSSKPDLMVRKLIITPQVEFFDNLAKKKKMGIKSKANIKTSFEIPNTLKPGNQNLSFQLQYQACTKDYCLMPIDLPFEVNATVINPDYKSKSKFSISNFNLNDSNAPLFLILIGLFIAGFFTSFTPCIYPMIPITMAILGSSSNDKKFIEKLLLSISYVLGIALTYALLGVLAASTGGLFGSYLNHPAVRIGIGIMFFVMALSMFGVYELQAPRFIRNKLANKKFKQNYLGAFLTGLVAGVIASPCVGPVLISVLTFVAQSGNIYLGFIYLFTFALGLGLIFIFIGLFSHLIEKLPRSGSWMEATKFIFGSVMVAASAYYLMPMISAPLKYILPILASIIVFYFSKKLLFSNSAKLTVNLLLIGIIIFSSLLFIPDLNFKIKNVFYNYGPYSPSWVTYSNDIYPRAKASNKGIIIDFYADWCDACKELEAKTFNQENVYNLGKNFIWVKYDATNKPKGYDEIRKKYNIKGLPHIVFYNKKNIYKKEHTLFGFENSKLFEQRLKKVLSD